MGIKQEVWIGWLGAVVLAAVIGTYTTINFVYGQFETRDHAREKSDAIERRLVRMEDKLDVIGGFGANRSPKSE